MKKKAVLDFLSEAGMLKRVKRSGWWMVGMPFEESVAEHSFRCACFGLFLAEMENADSKKVMIMTLLGDMPEARINDSHKVANRYLNASLMEKKVYKEQTALLGSFGKTLLAIRMEYDAQKTREAVIARDADLLECIMQAKEYVDMGFKSASKFLVTGPKHLKTRSAKGIFAVLKKTDTSSWWEALSKFER